ncbi:MAG TPA: FAD-dependent oxidoreductase [Methylocystis sp.]|nr:FAD-dependent oxidoreductase [Methylocystis sp.]
MTSSIDASKAGGSDRPHGKTRVAIIGGGPGGLFSAWHLEAKAGDACEIEIYESSERIGGKICTGQMAGIGPYEIGVAEIYDYSRLGPDPLRDLIENELKLDIRHIEGGPCVLDGKLMLTVDEIGEHFGALAESEARRFRERCAKMLSPEAYYLSAIENDNAHPWQRLSGHELLDREIDDEAARRYARVMAHSDVAAPPHLTNGLNLLKNVLMDVDGYMDIFSVVGGNEQIVQRLADQLTARINLNAHVRAVEPLSDGTYRLDMLVNGFAESTVADYVVFAVPLSAISMIGLRSETLRQTVDRHIGYFDRPAHYLRATLAFKRPFWRERIDKHWWMMDAFDGVCVYDESARQELGPFGVLSFLIAGNAALSLANVSDERIEHMCLDALAPVFPEAPDLIVNRRVHRWMASVNAMPGGARARRRVENHRPNAERLPGVLIVGDYLFDSTLNGVMDSADTATDIIVADLLKTRHAARKASSAPGETARRCGVLQQFFDAATLADMLATAFGIEKGARILQFGSESGELVTALRALGFDAYGFEFDVDLAHGGGERNLVGECPDLPFDAQFFDVTIETGLCRTPPEHLEETIASLARVTRRGLFLGSITADMPLDLVDRYDLLDGIETFGSRWDWADRLHVHGFAHALMQSERLDRVWRRAIEAGAGAGHWCEDTEGVLYCFYTPDETRQSGAELIRDAAVSA